MIINRPAHDETSYFLINLFTFTLVQEYFPGRVTRCNHENEGKNHRLLKTAWKMTRYLQRIFKLSRHALESVNKFPEVLICRKTPEDNNQGLLREKLRRLKLIQVWKQITYETSDTFSHHRWLRSDMYFSHFCSRHSIIKFFFTSVQNASCWILW